MSSFKSLFTRLQEIVDLKQDIYFANESDPFVRMNAAGRLLPEFKTNDRDDNGSRNFTQSVLALLESPDKDYGGWIVTQNVDDPLREGKKTFSIKMALEDNVYGYVAINWTPPRKINSPTLTAEILNAQPTELGTFTYKIGETTVTVGSQLSEGVNRISANFVPTDANLSPTKKVVTIIYNP